MKRIASLLALFAAFAFVLAAGASAAPMPGAVYDAVPSTLPPNVASVGFQATSTSEFGDFVHLVGTDRVLNAVTVTMSDWAVYSDYATDARYMGNTATWTHPVTLDVYDSHLALLGTATQTITIPWRPAADPTCATATAYRAADGQCYNGIAFNATFDMSSLHLTLPNDVILGVAFNTQSYGATPLVVGGPYNSLNVGVPTGDVPTVGTDDNADAVYWNTSFAGFYNDGGAGGVSTFRQDIGWAPNGTVAFEIDAAAALNGPPTSKDQCKNGGWTTFNNPVFKNQGDCVSYVATGGKH